MEDAPPTESTAEAEPTRSEINLATQAVNQKWPIATATQERITRHLAELVLKTDTRPRTAIAAAKALGAFGRLSLDQAKLDAAAAPEHTEPTAPTEVDTRDVLESMADYQKAKAHVLSLWNKQS